MENRNGKDERIETVTINKNQNTHNLLFYFR